MVIVLVSVLRQLVENYTNYKHCIVHSVKVLQLTVRLKMNCKKIYKKKKKIQVSLFLSNDWVCYL